MLAESPPSGPSFPCGRWCARLWLTADAFAGVDYGRAAPHGFDIMVGRSRRCHWGFRHRGAVPGAGHRTHGHRRARRLRHHGSVAGTGRHVQRGNARPHSACRASSLALVSIWLVARPDGEIDTHRGLGLAVLAGVMFGLFLIAGKHAGHHGVFWPLVAARTASTLLMLVIVAFSAARHRARCVRPSFQFCSPGYWILLRMRCSSPPRNTDASTSLRYCRRFIRPAR